MKLTICKYGERVLRERAKRVEQVTDELRRLADDMVETMHDARGVGLAAQQVGRTESLCVVDVPLSCEEDDDAVFNAPVPMPLKLWNPEIISCEGSQRDKEGCLSFPGIGGSLVRAAQVTVRYCDEKNQVSMITARGFLARALQHEIDHLNGILYIDHMSALERLEYASRLKKLAKLNGGVR